MMWHRLCPSQKVETIILLLTGNDEEEYGDNTSRDCMTMASVSARVHRS
jgi:hypothetical protein